MSKETPYYVEHCVEPFFRAVACTSKGCDGAFTEKSEKTVWDEREQSATAVHECPKCHATKTLYEKDFPGIRYRILERIPTTGGA